MIELWKVSRFKLVAINAKRTLSTRFESDTFSIQEKNPGWKTCPSPAPVLGGYAAENRGADFFKYLVP